MSRLERALERDGGVGSDEEELPSFLRLNPNQVGGFITCIWEVLVQGAWIWSGFFSHGSSCFAFSENRDTHVRNECA